MANKDIKYKILQWLTRIVLFAPIVFGAEFVFPFVHLKNIFFRVFALIIIILALVVWRENYAFYKNKYKKIPFVFLSLGVFLLVMFVANIFGVDTYRSLWGNFERMDGWMHWLLLLGYLFGLLVAHRETKEWIKTIFTSTVVAFGLIVIAIFSGGGLGVYSNDWSRLGNSSFVGLYMLLHVWLVALLAVIDKCKRRRVFYAILFVLFLLFMFLAASRGAILGFFVGVFVVAFLLLGRLGKKARVGVSLGLVLFLIFMGWAFFNKESQIVEKMHWLDRIVHISQEDGTTNNRLLVWQSAFSAFKERPVLGYGQENFHLAINKSFDYRISEDWFDRSHNVILDQLIFGGILGILAYFAVVYATFRTILLLEKKDKLVAIISLGLFLSYFTTVMFTFDTLNSYLPLFLAIAVLIGLTHSSEGESAGRKELSENVYLTILSVLVIWAVFMLWLGVVQPYKANKSGVEALKWQVADVDKSLEYFDKSIKEGSFGTRELVMQLARYVITTKRPEYVENFSLEDRTRIIQKAESEIMRMLEKNDKDSQLRMSLAYAYLSYADYDKAYYKKTVDLLEPYKDLSPGRVKFRFLLAQAYYKMGRIDKSIEVLEEALWITNGEDKEVYKNLISMNAVAGNQNKVIEYGRIYENDFDLPGEEYRILGEFYWRVGLPDESERVLLEEAIPSDYASWRGHVSLASVYSLKGETGKAIDYLEKMMAEQPENAEVYGDYLGELKGRLEE